MTWWATPGRCNSAPTRPIDEPSCGRFLQKLGDRRGGLGATGDGVARVGLLAVTDLHNHVFCCLSATVVTLHRMSLNGSAGERFGPGMAAQGAAPLRALKQDPARARDSTNQTLQTICQLIGQSSVAGQEMVVGIGSARQTGFVLARRCPKHWSRAHNLTTGSQFQPFPFALRPSPVAADMSFKAEILPCGGTNPLDLAPFEGGRSEPARIPHRG